MYKLLLIAKRHLVISYTRYANSVLASLEPRRFTRNKTLSLNSHLSNFIDPWSLSEILEK